MLKEQLREVHADLTAVTRDRNVLAELWQRPLGIEASTARGEIRRRVNKLRSQLGRLRRRYSDRELSVTQATTQMLRIAYSNSMQEPVEWAGRVRTAHRGSHESSLLDASPLGTLSTLRDYARAALWYDVLAPTHYEEKSFQLASRVMAAKSGRISLNLEMAAQLATSDHRYLRAVAQVNGQARELSGWIPRIPGPVDPMTPAATNVIMHLVKESRPYHSNEFTARSHENFKAEQQAGLEPVVVTELGFARTAGQAEAPEVKVFDGVAHHHLDAGIDVANVPSDRWLEDFAWLAYQKVKQIRPAVIHVSSGRRGYETALVALALKAKTGLPVVYEVRSFFEGDWTEDTEIDESSEIYRRRVAVENMCMQEADAVLTLGTAMRDALWARGIPKDKIGLIPNGVNLETLVSAPADPDLQERYGISMPTFGSVANMDHVREGQDHLIMAASLLKQRGVEAQCFLVGGGQRLPKLKQLARLYGVSDRVVFTGPIDHAEVAPHYRLIDVFVVPRIRELAATYVTPLKPFEAMALERPVIASNLPALAEIVAEPERGRLFEPGDAAALATTVERLLLDPDERRRLGQAGRAWIENERQWRHNGARYRTAFDRVQLVQPERAAPRLESSKGV